MSQVESRVEYENLSVGNPLARIVEQQIQHNGPIPFDQYMSMWLYGETSREGLHVPGYYTGTDVKIEDRSTGEIGDFITPSERTPLYGFAFANQVKQMWDNMGRPDDFKVVEMGAGNGTLADAILAGLRDIQEQTNEAIFDNSRYVIVEKSPTLMARQKTKLSEFGEKVDLILGSAYNLPLSGVKGVVVTTELVDAFPVKMIRKNEDGVCEELYIDNQNGDLFAEVWGPLSDDAKAYMEEYKPSIIEGTFYPLNIASVLWMEEVARMLEQGYVITEDYHFEEDHPVRLYSEERDPDQKDINYHLNKGHLGKTDITSGIDFFLLHSVGKKQGLKTHGLKLQAQFLHGAGYDELLHRARKGMIDEDKFILNGRKGSIYSSENTAGSRHWRVLMQSKNDTSGNRLLGLN